MRTSINDDEEICKPQQVLKPDDNAILFPPYITLCLGALFIGCLGTIFSLVQNIHFTGLGISTSLVGISLIWTLIVVFFKRNKCLAQLKLVALVISIILLTLSLLTTVMILIKFANLCKNPSLEKFSFRDIDLKTSFIPRKLSDRYQVISYLNEERNSTQYVNVSETLPQNFLRQSNRPQWLELFIERAERCLAPNHQSRIHERDFGDLKLTWHASRIEYTLGLITDIGFQADFRKSTPNFKISCHNRLSLNPEPNFCSDAILSCWHDDESQ
ncbi:unnamed protein product [Moneuplotes crassus]|uniref:Uncharacterized protein n=1 Tax=Euplotes crassus TaxID=5936 RepID=A0AAD1XRQ1_EUPCR|nr:unnamed protein product [Moneuplotes crassus]